MSLQFYLKSKGFDFTNTRFNNVGAMGDGAQNISHDESIPLPFTCFPLPTTKSNCRVLIIKFCKLGRVMFSSKMSLAWIIVEYCQIKGIKYEVNGRIIRRI